VGASSASGAARRADAANRPSAANHSGETHACGRCLRYTVRIRSLTIPAACAGALLAPAAAHAGQLTTLKVRSCHVGTSPRDRQATFYAKMQSIPGTDHMAIRFRLFDSAGVRTPAAIPNTQLEQWHQSKSGVPGFAYAQTVTGLTAGGIYRVAVEFRWFDANGRVIRDIKRRSGECRELGQLANLAITGLGARAGSAPGTEVYAIDLLNDGTASARMVLVDIFVDGAQADVARVAMIDPAQTAVVRITGPSCKRRIRVVVDRPDAIHETTEEDNVLRARCPAVQP